MKNLKEIAKKLSNDINNNNDWLNREISFVVDGSYSNYYFSQMILAYYKKDANRRGKRGTNLVARVGIKLISRVYNCSNNQAVSVFKYLSNEEQDILNKDTKDNLDAYIEMIEG